MKSFRPTINDLCYVTCIIYTALRLSRRVVVAVVAVVVVVIVVVALVFLVIEYSSINDFPLHEGIVRQT